METIICLIRHGQTDWNKQKRIQGRINNQLNDTGKAQVQEVGRILKEQDPFWDIIIASPLDRAIDSAKIIAKELNYTGDIIINNNVIEREFGDAEGEYITDEIYDKITKDVVNNLEKSYELQKRAFDALMDIAKTYPGKKILIATHSHFIKGFFTAISDDFTFTTPLYNASLNYVHIKNNKVIKYIFNKHNF
jgi:broad specificity phosphatase PhoE